MRSRRSFLAAAGGVMGMLTAPISLGSASRGTAHFQMPEESAPHVRTFMQWPVNRIVHPDAVFLEMLQGAIAGIANAIAAFEPVVMLMGKDHAARARRLLDGSIEIWNIPTDDLWCRDSGPVFVTGRRGELAISNLNFNGWGNKQVHANDARIVPRIAKRMGVPVRNNGLVGEAGGAEFDGAGTLMAHESSWVNTNRNKGTRAEIGNKMREVFGAEKIIWAPGVSGADITDYHIDSLARFVSPGTALIQLPQKIDRADPWSVSAVQTHEILKNATDHTGNRLKIFSLPEPAAPRVTSDDFVASYVNYYVCNGAVISAQFGDQDTDSEAVAVLSELYPDREIVTLNVDPVGETGGGIHCATQQQPVSAA